MENKVYGYKVFNSDWTCKDKQYFCPGKFEEKEKLKICGHGMHFCKRAADCFNYYQFNPKNKVAEVAAYGTVVEEGDKCCTDKLEIIREIPWQELLEIVNIGNCCTGLCNSGNCNSGDWNKTNFSNGCFNTIEPKIHLFNKPSKWTYYDWANSDAHHLLKLIPSDVLEYIWLDDDITDEEKVAHSEAETTGGYLKKRHSNNEDKQEWWNGLSAENKKVIKSIPNFDPEIFQEITGINVNKGENDE